MDAFSLQIVSPGKRAARQRDEGAWKHVVDAAGTSSEKFMTGWGGRKWFASVQKFKKSTSAFELA